MFDLFLLKAQKTIKKPYINVLSWVALGLATLSFYLTFMGFSFYPPSLIARILEIIPFILLVLYLNKFHNEDKGTIIVPIIFGLIAFLKIVNIPGLYFRGGIQYLALSIFCVLSAISALKGLTRKLFVLIAMGIGILSELILCIVVIPAVKYTDTSYKIGVYAEIISSALLYVSLLLFSLKFKIPAILSASPEKGKKGSVKMSPEQTLMALKDKLELGVITEEEYQAQRAEIIGKL